MKKKVLSLLLSVSMVLAVAGCGNTDTSSNTTDSSDNSVSTEESSTGSESSEEPEVPQEPEYDFNGRVVKIGSYYDMTPNPDGNVFEAAFSERIAFVEENYNCDIQFVELGGDYVDQYVTSVLAGTPVCDVGYILSYKLLPSLIEGGMLILSVIWELLIILSHGIISLQQKLVLIREKPIPWV